MRRMIGLSLPIAKQQLTFMKRVDPGLQSPSTQRLQNNVSEREENVQKNTRLLRVLSRVASLSSPTRPRVFEFPTPSPTKNGEIKKVTASMKNEYMVVYDDDGTVKACYKVEEQTGDDAENVMRMFPQVQDCEAGEDDDGVEEAEDDEDDVLKLDPKTQAFFELDAKNRVLDPEGRGPEKDEEKYINLESPRHTGTVLELRTKSSFGGSPTRQVENLRRRLIESNTQLEHPQLQTPDVAALAGPSPTAFAGMSAMTMVAGYLAYRAWALYRSIRTQDNACDEFEV